MFAHNLLPSNVYLHIGMWQHLHLNNSMKSRSVKRQVPKFMTIMFSKFMEVLKKIILYPIIGDTCWKNLAISNSIYKCRFIRDRFDFTFKPCEDGPNFHKASINYEQDSSCIRIVRPDILIFLSLLPDYLGTRWHVTQIIVTEEGVNRCLFWVAENLPYTIQFMSV